MTDVLALKVATPLLALVALLAIAWARRQDNQVRRKARQLQGRLETELDRFQAKSQMVGQRISMIADVYCRGNARRRAELTQGVNELVLRMHQVNSDLEAVADRLAVSQRRELRALHLRLVELAQSVTDLARDLDETDRMWSTKLSERNATTVERQVASEQRAMTTA